MRIRTLIKDEKGVSAVEYGLIISFIVLVMLAGLQNFATATVGQWNNVSDTVVNTTE